MDSPQDTGDILVWYSTEVRTIGDSCADPAMPAYLSEIRFGPT
jgi:hypothetical protein